MKKTALLLLLLLAPACGSKSGGGGFSGSTAPGATSTPTSGTTTAPPIATPVPPPSTGPIPDPTPMELAKIHAPYYRFNAWIPFETSFSNRNEDVFPMSAARFFDELATNSGRVLALPSKGPTPSINQVKASSKTASITAKAIESAPKNMVGDAPGTAPVYVHAWEDTTRRVRNPDGSGEDVFFIEYWLFYPQDEAKLQIWYLSGIAFPLGGHRADWEGTCYQVAKIRGPGGTFLRSEIRRGYFNAHGLRTSAETNELELVDDTGAKAASGTHPSVFVAVGKHGSYPEAGVAYDLTGTAPFVNMDEFFQGNGVTWRSWASPLLDMDGPVGPEFAPPSMLGLVAPGFTMTDWRAYDGRWGGDKSLVIFSGSPHGPRFNRNYEKGDQASSKWSQVRTSWGFMMRTQPPVVPPPLPTRS